MRACKRDTRARRKPGEFRPLGLTTNDSGRLLSEPVIMRNRYASPVLLSILGGELLYILELAMHISEARSRSDKRGVNLISDAFPFGGLWTSTIAFAPAQQG